MKEIDSLEESLFCHVWDFILFNNIATEKEMALVTDIIGNDAQSLKKIIRAREDESIEDLYNYSRGNYDWGTLTPFDLYHLDCISEEVYNKMREEENDDAAEDYDDDAVEVDEAAE
jgi:hypothetical protein